MTRHPLPGRRYSESGELVHAGILYRTTIGAYPDGRPGEVFLGMVQAAGTPMDVMARDIAVLISLCLQHGVAPETIHGATTKTADGQPEGLAGAVAALLVDWRPLEPAPATAPPIPIATTGDAEPVNAAHAARLRGFTGDQCSECRNFMMVRNGTCLKCEACGATTGCS